MYSNPDINPQILRFLGKVIISIAWADGVIQPEEVECLKQLIADLPDLSQEDINVLEDFLEHPVQPTEREVAIQNLVGLVSNYQERNFTVYWLDRIINSKGKDDPDEMAIHQDVMDRLMRKKEEQEARQKLNGHAPKNLSDSFGLAYKGSIDQILSELTESICMVDPVKNLAEDKLRKVALTGILTARITHADNRIMESEVDVTVDHFRQTLSIDKVEAHDLAKRILAAQIDEDMDVVKVCNELKKLTTEKERNDIVDFLFRISEEDNQLKDQEMCALINIAGALGIGQRMFEIFVNKVPLKV